MVTSAFPSFVIPDDVVSYEERWGIVRTLHAADAGASVCYAIFNDVVFDSQGALAAVYAPTFEAFSSADLAARQGKIMHAHAANTQ